MIKRPAFLVALGIIVATTVQLAVATFVPGLPQFEGKAFGARLISYPILMAVVPVVWFVKNRAHPREAPWGAFALVMTPFLVDVTGNTLDLYDALWWWDDLNHFVNWMFLMAGLGLLLARIAGRSRPLLIVAITGLGAVLAIAWELSEWYLFIRHGTEIETAYTDTLSDEALGTLGGFVAAVLVATLTREPVGAQASSTRIGAPSRHA